MATKKFLLTLLFCFIFLSVFPVTVFANSSWYWISETRPHDVLPFVIVLTLAIEILSIYFIPKTKNLPKVISLIFLANLFSFSAPYLFLYITPSLYSFEQTLKHTPFYTVGAVFLLVTLIVEVPTVYFALKKSSAKTKMLLFTVIGTNVITTLFTAVIERVVCRGSW